MGIQRWTRAHPCPDKAGREPGDQPRQPVGFLPRGLCPAFLMMMAKALV